MTHPTPEEIEAAVAGIKQLIELAEPEGPHYVEPEQVSQLRTLLSAVEQAQGMRRALGLIASCEKRQDGDVIDIAQKALSSLPPNLRADDPVIVRATSFLADPDHYPESRIFSDHPFTFEDLQKLIAAATGEKQ